MSAPLSMLRARARPAAVALAGARCALGLFALLAPDAAARPWVGAAAGAATHSRAGRTEAGQRVLARALGGRDLALGLGALLAAGRGAPVRGWVEAGVLADTGDALATVASFRALPPVGRLLVLGASAGAALLGAAVAPSV